jgi:transposase
VDTDTGEVQERRLQQREEAEKFYRDLATQGMKVRVGMEASGHARWFEGLLGELHFELWVGDAAEIRTRRVRKQKTDRQDAQLILKLMLKDDFPQIWVASWENRDLRQLLWHRHRMVQAFAPRQFLGRRVRIAVTHIPAAWPTWHGLVSHVDCRRQGLARPNFARGSASCRSAVPTALPL